MASGEFRAGPLLSGSATGFGYPALAPVFAAAEPAYRKVIAAIGRHADGLERIARRGSGLEGEIPARFEQEWFPRLDAATAYALVRETRPRRIVEVGSGHSTRFLAQAIADGDLRTDLLCVDPRPRASLAGFRVRHEARPFAPADAGEARRLEAGDVLFVDASHVAAPGTELELLLLDVLPALASGVLVHFHDVFLPDRYPESWRNRGYTEQLAIGALLQGGAYALIFASHYVAAHTGLMAGTVVEGWPLPAGAYEGSIWLCKG